MSGPSLFRLVLNCWCDVRSLVGLAYFWANVKLTAGEAGPRARRLRLACVTRRVFLSERSNGHEATTQITMSKPTTKDERSLLLYLETRAVDHGGKIRDANMNDLDLATLKAWTKSGYVKSGRIASEHMDAQHATWVHLSEQAMADAHDLRKARAERMWANKVYMTTDEKRSVGHGG